MTSKLRVNEIEMLDGIGRTYPTFDSVQDLKTSTTLSVGHKVRTLGYYAPGDGGGNDYEIVAAGTGTDDGGSFIDLSGSGLQAKRLFVGLTVLERDELDSLNTSELNEGAVVRVSDVGNFVFKDGVFYREKEAGREIVFTEDFTVPSRFLGETFVLRNNQKVTVTLPTSLGDDGDSVTFIVDGPGEIVVDSGGNSAIPLTQSRVPVTFLKYAGEWTVATGKSLELPAVRYELTDIKTTSTTASPDYTHTDVQFGDAEGRTLVLSFFDSGGTSQVPEKITVAGEEAVIFGSSGTSAVRVHHAIVQLPYDVTEGDVYFKYPDGESSFRHGFAVWAVYGLEDPFNPVDVRLTSSSSATTAQVKKGGVVLALSWGSLNAPEASPRLAEFAAYYAGANGAIDIDTEFENSEKLRWWGLTPKGRATIGSTSGGFGPAITFISLR